MDARRSNSNNHHHGHNPHTPLPHAGFDPTVTASADHNTANNGITAPADPLAANRIDMDNYVDVFGDYEVGQRVDSPTINAVELITQMSKSAQNYEALEYMLLQIFPDDNLPLGPIERDPELERFVRDMDQSLDILGARIEAFAAGTNEADLDNLLRYPPVGNDNAHAAPPNMDAAAGQNSRRHYTAPCGANEQDFPYDWTADSEFNEFSSVNNAQIDPLDANNPFLNTNYGGVDPAMAASYEEGRLDLGDFLDASQDPFAPDNYPMMPFLDFFNYPWPERRQQGDAAQTRRRRNREVVSIGYRMDQPEQEDREKSPEKAVEVDEAVQNNHVPHQIVHPELPIRQLPEAHRNGRAHPPPSMDHDLDLVVGPRGGGNVLHAAPLNEERMSPRKRHLTDEDVAVMPPQRGQIDHDQAQMRYRNPRYQEVPPQVALPMMMEAPPQAPLQHQQGALGPILPSEEDEIMDNSASHRSPSHRRRSSPPNQP